MLNRVLVTCSRPKLVTDISKIGCSKAGSENTKQAEDTTKKLTSFLRKNFRFRYFGKARKNPRVMKTTDKWEEKKTTSKKKAGKSI